LPSRLFFWFDQTKNILFNIYYYGKDY